MFRVYRACKRDEDVYPRICVYIYIYIYIHMYTPRRVLAPNSLGHDKLSSKPVLSNLNCQSNGVHGP